jgi:hypothetical protein
MPSSERGNEQNERVAASRVLVKSGATTSSASDKSCLHDEQVPPALQTIGSKRRPSALSRLTTTSREKGAALAARVGSGIAAYQTNTK